MVASATALRFTGPNMTAPIADTPKTTTVSNMQVDQRSADFIAAGLAGASSPEALAAHRMTTSFFLGAAKYWWTPCVIAGVLVGLNDHSVAAGIGTALITAPFFGIFGFVAGVVGRGNKRVIDEMKKRGLS